MTRTLATATQFADAPAPIAALVPAPAVESGSLVQMFERLATNPEVDVVKLERLIAMHERLVAGQAKADFDTAFALMQGQIPVITEQGAIVVEGKLRSKYATNEDIQEVVKPILQAHGFSLRFRHEVVDGWLKVIGILSHRSGHSEHDEFVTRADDSGKKNPIQAIGSARSYGQRYTTTALLNIATRGSDDDGVASGRVEAPLPPAGFEAWLKDFTATAETGWGPFQQAWNRTPVACRTYLQTQQPGVLTTLKTRARAFVAQPAKGGRMIVLTTDQRTSAWVDARLGRLTGSRAADMMATIAKGEAAGRRNLRTQLVLERLTGACQETTYVSRDMERGLELEPLALAAYEARTGSLVQRVGFLAHDELPAGCSLDGQVDDFTGILEVKCRRSANHLAFLKSGTVPADALWQVRHNLWISGAQWADYVSFDDRFPERLRLRIARVHVADVDLVAYELAVRLFLDEVDRDLEAVVALCAAPEVAA